VNPNAIRSLVAHLTSKVEAGKDLHSIPYRHANNFNKIPLYTDSRFGITVVLHVWRDHISSVDMDSDIHDHRWDFSSQILIGTLRNRLYEIDKDGEEQQAWAYRSVASGSTYGLIETAGIVRIQPSSAAQFGAGSRYYQRGHLLHTAAPLALPTVTVVARGCPERSAATILTEAGRLPSGGAGEELSAAPLSPDELLDDLRLASDALKAL